MSGQDCLQRTSLKSLAEFSRRLAQSNYLPATLSTVLELLGTMFAAEGVILWLVNDQPKQLLRRQIVHRGGAISPAFASLSERESLQFGQESAGQVWAKAVPVLVLMPAMFAPAGKENAVRILGLPIYAEGIVSGVVELVCCDINELDESTNSVLSIISAQLGAVIRAGSIGQAMQSLRRQLDDFSDSSKRDAQELRSAKQRLAKEHERTIKWSILHRQYLGQLAHQLRTQLGGIVGMAELFERMDLSQQQREYLTIMKDSAQVLFAIVEELDRRQVDEIEPLIAPLTTAGTAGTASAASEAAARQGQALPISPPESLAAGALAFPAAGVQKVSIDSARVLVVNGMIGSAEFVEVYAAAAGVRCKTATRGHTALILMKQAVQASKPFDVVFVEMVLPDMDAFEFARRVESDVDLARAQLILVSSFESAPRRERAMKSGFSLHLARPTKQNQVICAINAVLEGTVVGQLLSPDLLSDNSLSVTPALASGKPMILLAEDNPVNQKVALLQLKELGFYAKLVTNGSEAVEAVKTADFSAVLMDLQMPGMDGFEATRSIRQWERSTGRAPIPIVAMTAHSLPADRQKSLDAGMDDYLSKPVTYDTLGSVLFKWIERENETQAHAGENAMDKQPVGDNLQMTPDSTLGVPEPIDINSLQEMVGPEETVEILNIFVSSSEELLEKIGTASIVHDGTALKEAAHELKGACSSIGAAAMARTCQELENAARSDDWVIVPDLHQGLAQKFQVAKTYIQSKT